MKAFIFLLGLLILAGCAPDGRGMSVCDDEGNCREVLEVGKFDAEDNDTYAGKLMINLDRPKPMCEVYIDDRHINFKMCYNGSFWDNSSRSGLWFEINKTRYSFPGAQQAPEIIRFPPQFTLDYKIYQADGTERTWSLEEELERRAADLEVIWILESEGTGNAICLCDCGC